MAKKTDASEAAKALGKLGASKGGKARAMRLTPEERSDIARQAVEARWAKARESQEVVPALPRVTHGSEDHPLRITNIEIQCYVLEGGVRVITNRGLQRALGMAESGGAQRLADLMGRFESKSVAVRDLPVRMKRPIEFRPVRGGRSAFGYEATVLADICDVIIDARRAGVLTTQHELRLADHCEILLQGFFRVGIIALIDEATGYQESRAKDALTKILEAFIAKELQAYVDAFPSDFYQQLFRLRGLDYPHDSVKRPQYFGCLTNDIVYKRLAPGILAELKRITPRQPSTGRRKHKYYQRLTANVGYPKLKEHLGAVVAVMKMSKDWNDFVSKLDQHYPRYGETRPLPFDDFNPNEDNGQGL